MCLGIPGQIVEFVDEANDIAKVEVSGVKRNISVALERLDLSALDLLFVENVGNLICPTHWSLGEDMRLCVLSVPEGHDKPIKYPQIFAVSDAIILNKVDLLQWVNFKRDFFYDAVRALNPGAPIFEISCTTGQGMTAWIDWLEQKRAAVLPA